MWEEELKEYKGFLRLEKGLSENSVDAYMLDMKKLLEFMAEQYPSIQPVDVTIDHLKEFIQWIAVLGTSERTQARIISGIKSFFRYLVLEETIENDPSELLEAPRLPQKLPIVLSVAEIDQLQEAIDLSKPEGHRNRAILETLYSCGLRVSELINLKISDLFFNDGFIRISGKGNKERLVPAGNKAIKDINLYLNHYRQNLKYIDKKSEDIVFLNRRGRQLTRVMIFTIIKRLTQEAALDKKVSPHTLRHSFATHMIEGGADLRAIQQMLGHESIITTEIYTHLNKEYLKEAIISYHPRS